MLQEGDRFGGYRIKKKLGQGGFATVYAAEQLSVGREVALKVIHEHLAYDPERFEREVKALVSVRDDHVVTVHDGGRTSDGQLFLSMTLISGSDLKTRLAARDLAGAELVRVLRGVAQAIDACHGAGILHRDIKPRNVMVDDRGRGILVDFGIAKGPALIDLTPTNVVMGTPEYLAPELFDSTEASRASDIYSFGCLVYEAFVGSVPLPTTKAADPQQKIAALKRQRATHGIARPSVRNHRLDPSTDGPILAALAAEPSRRPASAVSYLAPVIDAMAPDPADTVRIRARPEPRDPHPPHRGERLVAAGTRDRILTLAYGQVSSTRRFILLAAGSVALGLLVAALLVHA